MSPHLYRVSKLFEIVTKRYAVLEKVIKADNENQQERMKYVSAQRVQFLSSHK